MSREREFFLSAFPHYEDEYCALKRKITHDLDRLIFEVQTKMKKGERISLDTNTLFSKFNDPEKFSEIPFTIHASPHPASPKKSFLPSMGRLFGSGSKNPIDRTEVSDPDMHTVQYNMYDSHGELTPIRVKYRLSEIAEQDVKPFLDWASAQELTNLEVSRGNKPGWLMKDATYEEFRRLNLGQYLEEAPLKVRVPLDEKTRTWLMGSYQAIDQVRTAIRYVRFSLVRQSYVGDIFTTSMSVQEFHQGKSTRKLSGFAGHNRARSSPT